LLSDDKNWAEFEAALNQRTLRVYALEKRCVRLDTTSASGYWAVSKNGVFQFGHSKEHRPDLPQAKVMLAALDPLGDSKMMSLATRAHLVAGGDYYLGPLALTQAPQATIDAYPRRSRQTNKKTLPKMEGSFLVTPVPLPILYHPQRDLAHP